jgi:hypothetical protein
VVMSKANKDGGHCLFVPLSTLAHLLSRHCVKMFCFTHVSHRA